MVPHRTLPCPESGEGDPHNSNREVKFYFAILSTARLHRCWLKRSKSFSLTDCIDWRWLNAAQFEPMRKQVEALQRSKLTDVTAKVVIYDASKHAGGSNLSRWSQQLRGNLKSKL